MRTFNLFISHSWSYPNQYTGLMTLLKNRSYFKFRDYSVPANDPIHTAGTVAELRQAIKQKMAPCSAVLILAGVYASYSRWINEELDLAKDGFSEPKPIIAIAPWGSLRTSATVKAAADKIVRWNTESVVSAIRELA